MKGHALLIGVNEVDTIHYGEDLKMDCALTDVVEMNKFLERIPIYRGNIKCLNNSDTSWGNITTCLKNYVALSHQEEGILVIYYSGHGAQLGRDPKGFYTFFDQLVSEKQIKNELSQIGSKFKVFLIADTCYSGELVDENFFTNIISEDIQNTFDLVELKTKNIKPDYFEEIVRKHKPFYDEALLDNDDTPFNPNCEVAILTACEDDQFALANSTNSFPSLFTQTILTTWSKNYSFNYDVFLRNLQIKNGKESKPSINFYGKVPTGFFQRTIPFLFENTQAICVDDLYSEEHFTEVSGRLVSFLGLPSGSSNYHYVTSMTYKFDDPGIIKITEQIDEICLDPVIGIIYVSESIPNIMPFPQYIIKMKSATVNADYGVILVVDWNSSSTSSPIILHKGRTRGKVNNKLG